MSGTPLRGGRALLQAAVRSFGRYEVHAEIGDGAMGRVYRSFDPVVGRAVAIKTVKGEYLTRDTRSEYLIRFRREAQAAGRLSHPNIVSIFDVGEDYFVMEYVEGIPLHDLLRLRTVLDLSAALRLLAPIADALDYAHRCGVVHRDIKPANIMVQPDGRPKLMDFGVARLETSITTPSGRLFGSPSYIPPEQILGEKVTHQADLFSLAVVAYEALTGKRPFQGESITAIIYRVLNEVPIPPCTLNGRLPPRFDDVFARALAKQAAQRYPTAMDFVSALAGEDPETSLADFVPEPVPEALIAPVSPADVDTQAIDTSPAGRRNRVAWLVTAAAVLALGAELTILARTSPGPRRGERATLATPLAASAALRVESLPSGATVWVDDVEVGQAPVALRDLAPGAHRLRVRHAGYASAELGLSLTVGVTPPPLQFIMSPLGAPLVVSSQPPAALVRVDGTGVGATPLANLMLEPGPHEVRVELTDFRPAVHRVEARPGVPVRVEARLRPLVAAPVGARTATAVVPSAVAVPPPVAPGMLVDLAKVDTPPKPLSKEFARYPAAARQLRLVGTVGGELLITETGQVEDLRIQESAGAILDQAVVAAVQKWRFEPARKDGVPVKVRLPWKHTFR